MWSKRLKHAENVGSSIVMFILVCSMVGCFCYEEFMLKIGLFVGVDCLIGLMVNLVVVYSLKVRLTKGCLAVY